MSKTLGYSVTFRSHRFEIFNPEGTWVMAVRSVSELFDAIADLGLVHPDYSVSARLAINQSMKVANV
jgi:hypothetical protein